MTRRERALIPLFDPSAWRRVENAAEEAAENGVLEMKRARKKR
jgi:hypothetical protein